MRKVNKITYTLAAVIVAMCFFLFSLMGSGVAVASAATSINAEFDKTNVLDDLEKSTIDGKPFSLEDYGFNSRKDTQVFSFVEFCYSFYEDLQADYGLYLYLYNPKGLKFVTDSDLNTVNLRAGSDENAPFHKYPLTYLNQSEAENYEGLFYKFKVGLTENQRREILDTVNSSNRIYRVAEVELLQEKDMNATAIPVATTYSYKGYAGGYGSNSNAESTLECTTEQCDTLSLKPYTTTYRPSGSNGKGNCTQDSLHSVYFAVPNDFINRYGEMSAVRATWLNAVLAPMLVTGNEAAYNAISPLLGKNIGLYTDALDFHYYGDLDVTRTSGMGNFTEYAYGFGYNAHVPNNFMFWDGDTKFEKDGKVSYENPREGYDIETLYSMFFAGSGTDSADSCIITSEMIRDKLLAGTKSYGGELINGKYSKVLFESVDKAFTEVNIKRDETFDLTSQTISKSWWDKLWNLQGNVSTTVFDGIQAIYPVKQSDLSGTPEEVCKRLYISMGDYEAFKKYFEANMATSTVYLFRYQVSDYISQEATLYKGSGAFGFKKVDMNAYFFQETVNLDFDIIDVTFSNGEVKSVIPVVMSPTDFISSATPPIHTNSDLQFNLLKLILGVLAVILLFVVFSPILMPLLGFLVKILLWLISLPFKAVGALISGIKRGR